MARKRSLMDVSKDPSAKDAFIRAGSKKTLKKAAVEIKMLNTRIPKDLIKRVKAYCVEHETTVREFVTETLEERLNR